MEVKISRGVFPNADLGQVPENFAKMAAKFRKLKIRKIVIIVSSFMIRQSDHPVMEQ